MQAHRGQRVGHRLELAAARRVHHGGQHVLARATALEKAPRAVVREEGRRDDRCAHDAAGREERGRARFEIGDAVAAEETAEPGGVTILGEADDLHGCVSLRRVVTRAGGRHPRVYDPR